MQKDTVDLKITNLYYFHIIHTHSCFGKNRYQELKWKLSNHCALSLIMLFLSFFIFGSAGSSLLWSGPRGGGSSGCGAWALGRVDFSSCGSRAQAHWLQHTGVVAPQHVGSSWIRNRTYVSCIGRWILYHWATREACTLSFRFLANVYIQAYLRDIVGLVPDHGDKENTAIKWVIQIFWFPSVYKSYVSTIL